MAAKKKTAKTSPSSKAGTKKSATTTPTTPTAPKSPPAVTGSQEAFDAFLPAANAIAAKDVAVCRADPSLVFHNVDVGVAAVVAEKARLAKELPAVGLAELSELPSLALALAFAASQVNRTAQANASLAKDLADAHPLRRKLLSSASALAEAGLLPAGDVAKIQRGTGSIDAATDLVALSALFAKHAKAIAGKSPIAAADVKRADALGSALLATLKPASAKKSGPAPGAAAAEARDRLWTLLTRRHDVLRRAGGWLFGPDALDVRVPSLLAHSNRSKKKQATTTPAAPAKAP